MTAIKITEAFQATLAAITEAGKTPWVIINADQAIGAYGGRTEARNAKAAENLVGKILKVDEVQFEIVKPVAPIGTEIEGDVHDYRCPHCGIDLENGVGSHLQEVNGEYVKHEKYEYSCLGCDEEFGSKITKGAAKKAVTPRGANANASTIENPCKRVWHIADEMSAANPEMKRKDVLARCVAEGIAFYTARTQYQQWLGIQREMAEREAQQKK